MLIGDGGAQSEAPREEGKQEVVPVSFASGLQLFKRQHSIPSGDARGRGLGRWWACGLVTFQRALAAARQDKNGEPTKTAVSRAPEPADSSNQARQGPENWRRLPTGPSRVDPHPQPPPASILRRQGTWFLKSEFTDETKTWTTSTSLMAMDISDYEIPCAMIFPFSLLQIQPVSQTMSTFSAGLRRGRHQRHGSPGLAERSAQGKRHNANATRRYSWQRVTDVRSCLSRLQEIQFIRTQAIMVRHLNTVPRTRGTL